MVTLLPLWNLILTMPTSTITEARFCVCLKNFRLLCPIHSFYEISATGAPAYRPDQCSHCRLQQGSGPPAQFPSCLCSKAVHRLQVEAITGLADSLISLNSGLPTQLGILVQLTRSLNNPTRQGRNSPSMKDKNLQGKFIRSPSCISSRFIILLFLSPTGVWKSMPSMLKY